MSTPKTSPRPSAGSALDERATDTLSAESDPAFQTYWQGLLEMSPALRTYRDDSRIRGVSFADFRAAMADAFQAGRTSTL